MWGRDPFEAVLQAHIAPAKTQAQEIADAMWAGIVPAGVVQIEGGPNRGKTPMTGVYDQTGKPYTQEERQKLAEYRKTPFSWDAYHAGTLDYQKEVPPDLAEPVWNFTDRFTPQRMRLSKVLEAVITVKKD